MPRHFGPPAPQGVTSAQLPLASQHAVHALSRFGRELIARTTFGTSVATRQRLASVGALNWVDYQLDWQAIDEGDLVTELAPWNWIGRSAAQLFAGHGVSNAGVLRREIRGTRLLRATHSPRQLYERMVEFWNDHFNVPMFDGTLIFLKHPFEEGCLRPHALGSFPSMLLGTAHSAAMLHYLDNESNVVGAPNENYARELMELHTIGVDGPYTETDVQEIARCFTGWDWVPTNQNGDYGEFRFVAAHHDDGPKVVLGTSIPAGGGMQDGLTVLHLLAQHPCTANFLSQKLCRWFLSYDPPQDLVDRAAAAYLTTGGWIPAMLRVILAPSSFSAVPPRLNRKLKRPLHFAVSVVRALDGKISDIVQAIKTLEPMGHKLYDWEPPDGYPDSLDSWAGGLLARWAWAADVLSGQSIFIQMPLSALEASIGQAPRSQWARAIDRRLTGGATEPQLIAQQQAFIDGLPQVPESLRLAFEAAISTPGFQLY